jgi:hypothetical protein
MFLEGLRLGQENNARPILIACLMGFAPILADDGYPARALELLTLVERYPRTYVLQTADRAAGLRDRLTDTLSPAEVQEAVERGRTTDIYDAVDDLLKKEETP